MHSLSLPIPPAAHNRNNSLKIQFVSKFSRVSRLHFPNSGGRSLFPMPRRAKPLIKISTTRRISHLLINPPPAEPVEPLEPQSLRIHKRGYKNRFRAACKLKFAVFPIKFPLEFQEPIFFNGFSDLLHQVNKEMQIMIGKQHS